jgi:hypothetical protein
MHKSLYSQTKEMLSTVCHANLQSISNSSFVTSEYASTNIRQKKKKYERSGIRKET